MNDKQQQTKTLDVTVPDYVARYLETEAERFGVSVDDLATYFFARKVVHTSK